MDIKVKSFTDLTDQDMKDWRRLQEGDPSLANPFFSPDFAGAIDGAGKPVFVAIALEQNALTGIFPFHRGPLGVGVPVGGQICDYHGILGPLKDSVDIATFLKACGLQAYDFNHLPATQTALAQGSFRNTFSPCIDLNEGFDTYFAQRSATSNSELKNTARKYRKLNKEIGSIRVEINDQSEEAWQTLIEWKNQMLKQMGVRSILDVPWVHKAMESIRETDNPHFAGMVSSLYVGDKLAAAHFGMRSHTTLHWWFPTYDQGLAKYSPGIVLLFEVAKRIPGFGLSKLDLGRGTERYKIAFANGSTELCEGSIENPASLAGSARVLRKSIDRTLTRFPSLVRPTQFQRRAFNRVLSAVQLPK